MRPCLGSRRQSQAVAGSPRKSQAVAGGRRQSQAFADSPRQSQTVAGSRRKSQAVADTRRQSPPLCTVKALPGGAKSTAEEIAMPLIGPQFWVPKSGPPGVRYFARAGEQCRRQIIHMLPDTST